MPASSSGFRTDTVRSKCGRPRSTRPSVTSSGSWCPERTNQGSTNCDASGVGADAPRYRATVGSNSRAVGIRSDCSSSTREAWSATSTWCRRTIRPSAGMCMGRSGTSRFQTVRVARSRRDTFSFWSTRTNRNDASSSSPSATARRPISTARGGRHHDVSHGEAPLDLAVFSIREKLTISKKCAKIALDK